MSNKSGLMWALLAGLCVGKILSLSPPAPEMCAACHDTGRVLSVGADRPCLYIHDTHRHPQSGVE